MTEHDSNWKLKLISLKLCEHVHEDENDVRIR